MSKPLSRKTRIVRMLCTREQIYVHKCVLDLQVPNDATEDELLELHQSDLIELPWTPLSEPVYDDEDRLSIESIEEHTSGGQSVDGIVVRDDDGNLTVDWSE